MRQLPLVLLAALPACASTAAPHRASVEHWIAFASSRTGDGDVYALKPSTGALVLVAGTERGEGTVRYDAARQRIVHHEFTDDAAWLLSGGERLWVDPNGDVAPVWSPDGEWVAYVREAEGRQRLFRARPDGAGEEALTAGDATERYPAWSPDSSRLVFARRTEGGWDLFTVEPATGREAQLTDGRRYVGHPAWSPSGDRVAFDTYFDGHSDIAVLDVASGEITRVTDRAGNELIPAWAPDGGSLAFGGEPAGSGNWDLWSVDLGTLEVTRLTDHPAGDGGPVYVPAAALRDAVPPR